MRTTLDTLFTADERLDDIKRARIWAKLAPRLRAAPSTRRRWWIAGAALAVSAAIVVLLARASHPTTTALQLGPYGDAQLIGTSHVTIDNAGEHTHVTLLDGALNDERTAKRFVGNIAENGKRLESIVEDLLQLSRAESPDSGIALAPLDVHVRPAPWAAPLLGEQRLERRHRIDLAATRPASETRHGSDDPLGDQPMAGSPASAASTFSRGYS